MATTQGAYMQFEELRLRQKPGGGIGEGTAGDKAGRIAQKELLLRMMANGTPLVECSAQLKTAAVTLARWARQPEFLERLKALNEVVWRQLDEQLKNGIKTTMTRIQQASDDALDKVLELMNQADSEAVQLKAAQDVLDRNPETSKTHKVESRETKVTVDAQFLQLALKTEQELVVNG